MKYHCLLPTSFNLDTGPHQGTVDFWTISVTAFHHQPMHFWSIFNPHSIGSHFSNLWWLMTQNSLSKIYTLEFHWKLLNEWRNFFKKSFQVYVSLRQESSMLFCFHLMWYWHSHLQRVSLKRKKSDGKIECLLKLLILKAINGSHKSSLSSDSEYVIWMCNPYLWIISSKSQALFLDGDVMKSLSLGARLLFTTVTLRSEALSSVYLSLCSLSHLVSWYKMSYLHRKMGVL